VPPAAPVLSSLARVERNAEVVRDRARGFGWTRVAERHDLSERQCRRICEEWRESRPREHDQDPLDIFEELLESYNSGIEDLALVLEEASQDAVKVGAIKARLALIEDKAKLFQAVGILPDLGKLGEERDLRVLADTVWDVMDRHGVSEEARKDLAATIRGNPPARGSETDQGDPPSAGRPRSAAVVPPDKDAPSPGIPARAV